MFKFPPHSYGPASVPAMGVRHHINSYLTEAKEQRRLGRYIARRACIEMALVTRANFRNSRVS